MLWTQFVVLLVQWLLSLVSSHTMGASFISLLVLPVVALIFQLLTNRHTGA